jgi:hypothetical protein
MNTILRIVTVGLVGLTTPILRAHRTSLDDEQCSVGAVKNEVGWWALDK